MKQVFTHTHTHTHYIINDGGKTYFQVLGAIRVVHKQEYLFIVGQR